MRLREVHFMTWDEFRVRLVNDEDWVIRLYVNEEDKGYTVCPSSMRVTMSHLDRSWEPLASFIAEWVGENVKLKDSEFEHFRDDMKTLIQFLV